MNWKFGKFLPLMLLLSVESVTAQDCLQGAESTRTQIPFKDLGGSATPLPTGSQAIATSYQFQCCGEILEWGTHVSPDNSRFQSGVYTIHFQVWRPSPTSGGGDGGVCYSLVGENRFPEVTFPPGDPVRESPLSSDRISVRPGDVLGYFVISNSPNAPQRPQGVQLDSSFTNDVVFYADIGDNPLPMGPEACPVSVGPGGVLSRSTNAAPVFSVKIGKSSCPPPIRTTSTRSSTTQTPTETPSPALPTTTTDPRALNTTMRPPTTDDTPTTMEPTMKDKAVTNIQPSRTTPRTTTIFPATDIEAGEKSEGNGSGVLPAVIGATVAMTILAASLTTLIMVIAIARRKRSSSGGTFDTQENIYNLAVEEPHSNGSNEMETSTHFTTNHHTYMELRTNTPSEFSVESVHTPTTPSNQDLEDQIDQDHEYELVITRRRSSNSSTSDNQEHIYSLATAATHSQSSSSIELTPNRAYRVTASGFSDQNQEDQDRREYEGGYKITGTIHDPDEDYYGYVIT